MTEVQRPEACPKPGQIEAFDAGWNAHEKGLERETVRVLTPESGRAWALLAWEIREKVSRRTAVAYRCSGASYHLPTCGGTCGDIEDAGIALRCPACGAQGATVITPSGCAVCGTAIS